VGRGDMGLVASYVGLHDGLDTPGHRHTDRHTDIHAPKWH